MMRTTITTLRRVFLRNLLFLLLSQSVLVPVRVSAQVQVQNQTDGNSRVNGSDATASIEQTSAGSTTRAVDQTTVAANARSNQSQLTKSTSKNPPPGESAPIGYNPHRQIRIDVFDQYIPSIPIVNNQSVKVRMNLQMVMLVDVNEPEEAILLNGWIMVFWKDDWLQWNPAIYNSTSAEFPSTTKLWVPDITWYERIPMVEAYESDAGIFSGARAVVRHTGDVYISRGLLMKSHCALSVENFPFDRQECNFTFSSNLHSIDRLVLSIVDNRRESLTDTEGWTMLGFPARCYNKTYKGVGTFNRIVFSLQMKRKPMFYVFYLMLPSFLISALSCLVFILPPQSSEKVPFCVSILLSLTVFMMIMTGLTPPTEAVPLLSLYFFLVLLLAMLNAAATIAIENVYYATGVASCLLLKICGYPKKKKKLINRDTTVELFATVPQRANASLAQAANLAHHNEDENLNGYATCAAIETDLCGDSQRRCDANDSVKGSPIENHDVIGKRERIFLVKRLNRICFVLSLTTALSTPVLFTLYGFSDHDPH